MYSGTKEFNAGDTVYFPQNGYWSTATVVGGRWSPGNGKPTQWFFIEVSVRRSPDDKIYYYYASPSNLYTAKEVFSFRLRGVIPEIKSIGTGCERGHWFPYVALDGDTFYHTGEKQVFMYAAEMNSWIRILTEPMTIPDELAPDMEWLRVMDYVPA